MIVNILLGVRRITIPKVAGPGFGCLEYYLVFIYTTISLKILNVFGKMWVQIHLISSTSYMIVFTPPSQTPELLYKY